MTWNNSVVPDVPYGEAFGGNPVYNWYQCQTSYCQRRGAFPRYDAVAPECDGCHRRMKVVDAPTGA